MKLPKIGSRLVKIEEYIDGAILVFSDGNEITVARPKKKRKKNVVLPGQLSLFTPEELNG